MTDNPEIHEVPTQPDSETENHQQVLTETAIAANTWFISFAQLAVDRMLDRYGVAYAEDEHATTMDCAA